MSCYLNVKGILGCYLIMSVAIALSTAYLAVYCLIDVADSVKDEEQKQQRLLFKGNTSQSLKETIYIYI